MAKGTFVNLAQKYKPGMRIANHYASEKMEGIRAIWDGGLTRGLPLTNVPWANLEKDRKKKLTLKSTGLWSRYGNVIHAPDWFLDQLPNAILDGELYVGKGRQQSTNSIILSENGAAWNVVTFQVFCALTINQLMQPDKLPWHGQHTLLDLKIKVEEPKRLDFPGVYDWMQNLKLPKIVQVVPQIHLPHEQRAAEDTLFEMMRRIVDAGGEGIVLRDGMSSWQPERTKTLLKVKPAEDSEGLVVGYKWAKEGKIEGMLGSLRVTWEGKIFDLSGFTEAERTLIYDRDKVKPEPGAYIEPGSVICPLFPIGAAVTFMYRGLTEHGMPVEARYLRRREGA